MPALLSQAQFLDQISIRVEIFSFEIAQKSFSLTYKFQKTSFGKMVLFVHAEMQIQIIDSSM